MTGKIIKGIAGFYYVDDGRESYECRARGIFRNNGLKPLVGDLVEFTVLDEGGREGSVTDILPRKNQLIRPAVANVDQALVIFSVTSPEPNLNLLDRFLVMMAVHGIGTVICFNKTDLTREEDQERLGAIYAAAGYPVYFTSALKGRGIDDLRGLVGGKTTVLAGPSGVGKSSLTNLLFPEAEMETGGISQKIQRGKHTTRHSQLFKMGKDTYMMDTPGFSSMYLEDVRCGGLKEYFPEFAAFQEACRFLGCVHVGEPVCGVKEAVRGGGISKSRYDNYLLLYQELKEKRRY